MFVSAADVFAGGSYYDRGSRLSVCARALKERWVLCEFSRLKAADVKFAEEVG